VESLLRQLASFNFFYSVPFWGILAAIVVVVRLLHRSRPLVGCLMLAISAAMILALPRVGAADLLVLGGLSGVVFAAAKALTAASWFTTKSRRVALTAATVVAVLLVLVFFKYRIFQDLLLRPHGVFRFGLRDYLFVIGISYFSFRLIHVAIECHRGKIVEVDALSFLNYVLFFPAFISGPIHRYDDFQKQWKTFGDSNLASDVRDGLYRIVNGLFKKLVLAEIVSGSTLTSLLASDAFSSWHLVLGIYCSTLFFWFDFSGYSDLAIGTGRLLGIVLPENFRQPFLKPNIQQLWASWHMSLTRWLEDYVYWPLVRRLRGVGFYRRHPVLLSNTGIIVTFAVCGMWHGATLNFLVWGLYHGCGIAAMNVYKSFKKRVRIAWLKRYFLSPVSRVVGAVVSAHFFALGIVLFSLTFDELARLLAGL
jgi:alginate O-acetyltransferase complex protein AlgI